MALVSKTFSQIITFTRASTATYFDSTGTLTSAAVDAPRLDYNPSTLAAQGFLVEEARTNLCLQSEDWGSATWSKSGSTITANATTAPTGTTVADKLVEDTSTGTHITTQSISLGGSVDNSAYVISVFAKASERTRFQLFDNAQASSGITSFDLSNGTVVSGTGTITAVGNGWYRCSVFPLKSTSITSTLTIRLISTGSTTNYTGDGTSGIFVFGAQLEVGAFPTSYIPTTTTALTRAADVASVNTLSPWYNASAGTVYAEATGPIANIYRILAEGASAADFRDFSLSFDGLRGNFTSRFVTGNFDVLGPANSLTAGATVKLAGSYSSTSADLAYGGTLAVTKNAVTQRIPADRIFLGSRLGTSLQLNGHLRRLTYYPRTLSTAELQAITA
jgi:hypothetical protein